MRNYYRILLLGTVGLLFAGSAMAQSCPGTTLTNAGTSTLDLCSGTNFVTKYCGLLNNPSEDYAFQFSLSGSYSATGITLTNVSGGWAPEMVLQQTCGSTTDCTATQTVGTGAGNSATLLFSSASTTITTGTTYYILVTSTAASTCPTSETFTLAPNGTLPVKLENFSID